MFGIFLRWSELWLLALLVLLLLGPVVFYLIGPWAHRRREIVESFSDESVKLYFDLFHQGADSRDFVKFYNARFGRRWHVIPAIMLIATSATSVLWSIRTVLVWVHVREATVGVLPDVAVLAFAGAYVWVLADLITRWRFRDLSPADLWWSSCRLVMAAPLAYAVRAVVAPAIAPAAAFFLGALPTRQITTIARRLARRQLNLGADADEKGESELENLQGIDTRIAERFADEGITTVDQLAYADPVELTMRCASLAFSFVMDCQSQALAWIYLGDRLSALRVWSLRGSQEIANLVEELDGTDEVARAVAQKALDGAAKVVGVDAEAFARTLDEIAEDPYTVFLNTVWVTDK